jgi:hypothetical protein
VEWFGRVGVEFSLESKLGVLGPNIKCMMFVRMALNRRRSRGVRDLPIHRKIIMAGREYLILNFVYYIY